MRTFDDIIPPSRRREMEPVITPNQNNQYTPPTGPSRFPEQRPRFPFVTLGAIVLVIVISVGALFYFSIAKVEVIPNTVSAAVQGTFTANQTGGTLPYQIITTQKVASQSVKGSGTKTVNTSASGTITIYNTQTKAQPLIATTRFATAAGLIFRIRTGVTVPGGSEANPGSVTAKVYADKEGSAYNVAPTSFTIPGFAGTPQAKSVYARSSTAMSGGASGSVPVVDAALEAQTRSALIAALAPDLLAAIKTQVPDGYILLDGAATTTYEELPSAPSGTADQASVKEQGTITAVVFPNAALAKTVATPVSALGYQGEALTLAPASKLVLSASAMPDPGATSFSFTLSGTASLIYTVDPIRIAAAVAGKTRSAAEVALTSYPEIKRALIILRPFWRQSFPQDPSSISIVVANP